MYCLITSSTWPGLYIRCCQEIGYNLVGIDQTLFSINFSLLGSRGHREEAKALALIPPAQLTQLILWTARRTQLMLKRTRSFCIHSLHTLIADGNHNCCKDAMGPEMSKLETGKSSSCIACVGPGDGTGKT